MMLSLLPTALAAFVGLAAANAFGPPASCDSTDVEGARRCADQIFNQINTSAACKSLCCASSAAHPVPPIPGVATPGCVAWFHNQYSQCFFCNGIDKHGTKTVVP
jgi:hypothetical protein